MIADMLTALVGVVPTRATGSVCNVCLWQTDRLNPVTGVCPACELEAMLNQPISAP